jgi:hypothetical protein
MELRDKPQRNAPTAAIVLVILVWILTIDLLVTMLWRL